MLLWRIYAQHNSAFSDLRQTNLMRCQWRLHTDYSKPIQNKSWHHSCFILLSATLVCLSDRVVSSHKSHCLFATHEGIHDVIHVLNEWQFEGVFRWDLVLIDLRLHRALSVSSSPIGLNTAYQSVFDSNMGQALTVSSKAPSAHIWNKAPLGRRIRYSPWLLVFWPQSRRASWFGSSLRLSRNGHSPSETWQRKIPVFDR